MIMDVLSLSGCLCSSRIPVNYDTPDVINRAIDAAGLDCIRYVSLPAAVLKEASGEVIREVREVNFGQKMTNACLFEAVKEEGRSFGLADFKLADLLVYLLYLGTTRDRPAPYRLAILFYDLEGELWSADLNRYEFGSGVKSILHFRQTHPGRFWTEEMNFLGASGYSG
jgi:hypothetical protein